MPSSALHSTILLAADYQTARTAALLFRRGQPMSMPAASGYMASKPKSSSWIFGVRSRPCIPFISCQFRGTAHLTPFSAVPVGFHGILVTSNSIWLGLSGEIGIISPSESDHFLKSRTVTAPIVHSFVFSKESQGALHFFVLSQLTIVFCQQPMKTSIVVRGRLFK
jgi:hypothetical protein